MNYLHKLIDWHQGKLHNFEKSWGLDSYHMMWISFIKGILLVLLLQWIF